MTLSVPASDQIDCTSCAILAPSLTSVRGTLTKEPSFCNAKQDSTHHEPSEVLDKAGKGHDDSPRYDQDAKVGGWSLELLQDDIARDLEQDIWYEEYAERDVVLNAGKLQVCR